MELQITLFFYLTSCFGKLLFFFRKKIGKLECEIVNS